MKEFICSAGLVYVYLSGYEEEGLVKTNQINTYCHIEDGFYRQVMEKARLTDQNDDTVHVFAVIGEKEKANAVYGLLEEGIRENFHRILEGKSIRKSSPKLDKTGNAFFRCIQEFFCQQEDHFPKRMVYDYGDILFLGIQCSHLPEDVGDRLADSIVSLWLERERPGLCGRQLMIRSFFMRDFVGRKVVACIPQRLTGTWSLIFEGGGQLSIETESSYGKETIHPHELGAFSSSNMQTILLNPIYAYGMWLQPEDLCKEWHKVFLYLCAVSERVWDPYSISEVYEKFLVFLQNHICEVVHVEPFLSKEMYHGSLLKQIQQFRDFLKGEDEPVISKDLHQTMNSRYVYLPYLWPLVSPEETRMDDSLSEWKDMIAKALNAGSTYEKGVLWEDTAAYILESIPGWKITGRRIRAGYQEIDRSIVNVSLDDKLWQLGAYILAECKNWKKRVTLPQIRNIAHISNMKGNKTALLFAAGGITANAEREIHRLVPAGLSIICITADDLLRVRSGSDCRDMILEKWQALQDAMGVTDVM